MKIADITVGTVIQALDCYHRIAYAGLAVYKAPDLGEDPAYPITMFLDRFEDETVRGEARTSHRHILRLGNSRYPFMKFVMHEYLVQGEYFFSVDTHDEMFKGSQTESKEIAEIREFNSWVKRRIEELWTAEDLPTTASMNVLIQERHLMPREGTKNQTILVVDDDRHIGDTIQLVLEARGFDVERLFDGLDAVEEVDPDRHVLVIMDNQMAEMDGLEALRRLKADPERRKVPILITTTQNLDFTRLEAADAYLHKPFHADALMSFVNLLLGKQPGGGTAARR